MKIIYSCIYLFICLFSYLFFYRAAHDIWGKSLREYQCIDVSEDANNACEFLLRG